MRRRYDGATLPPELLEFPGWPVHTDALTWELGLDEWWAARRRWAAAHGMSESVLPATIGDAPWDQSTI
ncbi:hypothetical protein B4U45_18360 [Mycobacterium persicum]|uniref:Uncharacterized protein n=1 Tax=Mycobacterium persicum TaxID=1487726 RepID=A0A8E2LNA8_9MYCO|nr:hypothetical protein [Mycobacterium persicum]KZS79943.1 hypothetical protein A4G31_17235 [Mycobacterium persicum]ORB40474.1 hypothetical protein BST40_21945 [Mycobacterium persicum]ORB96250.1 hypothetical protein B1T44_19060 [Mycobacterium persicum]ORC08271.1 hypothetical protein B4U45_18360 [Mycobacterium persicum]VAZ71744.1 hypothetical protein LAUMK15_00965 [Mycobacterium persicum]